MNWDQSIWIEGILGNLHGGSKRIEALGFSVESPSGGGQVS